MPIVGALRRVAVDIAFWYCLPSVFLVLYVGVLRQPASAVWPHLLIIALPLTVQAMLRLVLSRWISHTPLRLAVSSLVLALCIGAMITYYVLVLISVKFWGGVVAWPAIPMFFRQAPDIANAVGIPMLAVGAAVIVLMGSVLAASWFHLKRFDWTANLTRSVWVKALFASAACVALWLQVARATEAPWIAQAEPLSMSLFPLAGTRDIEGHRVTAEQARPLDDLENRARAKYVAAANGPRKNFILIVVDALRPGNMSLFGYARETTPYLDALSRTGSVRKLIAHAPCSDTACGLISLTTSRLPRDFSFHPFSIHEVLRRNGYKVHVIQSGDLSSLHPMRMYYGDVDTWFDGNSARTTSINDDQVVIDRLAAMPDWNGAPTLFQFHLMSAHITRKDDERRVFLPAKSYLLQASSDERGTDTTLPTAINFYDNGVLNADRRIGQIVDLLRQKGYLNRALIVVTADHGEALGEHGMFTHANSVREEVLKIPVVFMAEGYEPDPLVAASGFPLQIDIAPTVLTELKIPRPTTWKGRPLQDPYEPFITYFEERDFSGLIDTRQQNGLWKYWLDRALGREFVFDLSVDPHESRNVVADVPEPLLSAWRRHVVYTQH